MKRTTREGTDYQALADLRYEIRRFLTFSERAARAGGLEPQQHQALLALKGLPNGERATVGVLAERLQIQPHTAVELINRLASKRFVVRSKSLADRRVVLLELTRSGEKVLRGLSLMHQEELSTAGPKLIRALETAMRLSKNAAHARKSTSRNAIRRNKKRAKRR